MQISLHHVTDPLHSLASFIISSAYSLYKCVPYVHLISQTYISPYKPILRIGLWYHSFCGKWRWPVLRSPGAQLKIYTCTQMAGKIERSSKPDKKMTPPPKNLISEVNGLTQINYTFLERLLNLQISGENQNFLTSSWCLLAAKNWT